MAQQIDLFGALERAFVDDGTGRIAYYPGVFCAEESAQLFAQLLEQLPWSSETMWMYDRTVGVPRLIARFLPEQERPEQLRRVHERVEAFLDTRFTSISAQLYRDGNDSVAWHNDHREELVPFPVIAVVSLGATRSMWVRSKKRPRRTFSCDLDPGSLFVMSGRAQEFWEHHIPKVDRPIGRRISLALRQRKL